MAIRVLICGLPGTGKTTLARWLVPRISQDPNLRVGHLDGDKVRQQGSPLGFSPNDRITQAARMRYLADLGGKDKIVLASFICPTHAARNAFDSHITVWLVGLGNGLWPDTTALWQDPRQSPNLYKLTSPPSRWEREMLLTQLKRLLNKGAETPKLEAPAHLANPSLPTGLLVGRFQPFHAGHKALAEQVLKLHPQVCFAIRLMPQGPDNPLGYGEVSDLIHKAMTEHRGRYFVSCLPNIAGVYWGRDVGWDHGRLVLPTEVEAISGTKIRQTKGWGKGRTQRKNWMQD